jgi:hypothetical protein
MTSSRGASTLRELCARYKCSRSFLYEERHRGRLRISKAGKKALVFQEDEDTWRELCRATEPKAPERVFEELGTVDDLRDALDLAGQLVAAIAKLPPRRRDELAERFNDLLNERDLPSR